MSILFDLSKNDFIKGLVVAATGAILTYVYQSLTNGLIVDWHQVLIVAITSGLSYLIKNYFTDEQGKIMGVI